MKHEGPGSEVAARLATFENLIREWNPRLGLISERDSPRVYERHIEDCLRAADAVAPGELDAYDLGSGAGLPGIVVAIAKPLLLVTLVESRRNRAAFLELVVERLALGNARVYAGRAEDLRERVDLCFARAFGDARASWRIAEPLLRRGGRLVYFAGSGFDVARDGPAGPRIDVRPSLAIARSGPLVIMTRQ